MILLLNVILIGFVNAENVNTTVYTKGRCPDLLKYNGITVGCVRVAYHDGSSEFPAYCLERDLPGIGERDSYTVEIQDNLTNNLIWRVISNSFPYVSFQSLGVKNIDEAFVATKQAVYCILYGNDADNFSRYTAIGEAGERTLNALKKLVNNARNGDTSRPSNTINIVDESRKWNVDTIDKNYVSKTYSTNSSAIYFVYNIDLDNYKLPEGTKIVNLNNEEKNSFRQGEKFKVMIPINHNMEEVNLKIIASAVLGTRPVYYGKAPQGLQNYALAAYGYEDGQGELEEIAIKNKSKITIVKKDGKTNKFLSGTEFNILDEKKNIKYSNLITDENGEVIITGIEPGTYLLEEVKATNGYQKMDKLVEFNMELNKELTITVNNNKIQKSEIDINTEEITVSTEEKKTDISIKESNQEISEYREENNVGIDKTTQKSNSSFIKNTIDKNTVINTINDNTVTFTKKLPKTGF